MTQSAKRRWTEQELTMLQDLYPKTDTSLLPAMFGRSMSCIHKMAQSKGIRKNRDTLLRTKSRAAKETENNAGRFKRIHGLATAKNFGPVDPTYGTWLSMHQRCNYVGHKSYDRYGGRGIKVCEEWSDFARFLADMGQRQKGMTLGRIDNDADYSPANCRWETMKQQQRNRRSNRIIEAFGKSMTLVEWSEETGIRGDTISYRIKSGWGIENALTKSV